MDKTLFREEFTKPPIIKELPKRPPRPNKPFKVFINSPLIKSDQPPIQKPKTFPVTKGPPIYATKKPKKPQKYHQTPIYHKMVPMPATKAPIYRAMESPTVLKKGRFS